MADPSSDHGPTAPICHDVEELVDAYGDRLLRSACLLLGDEVEAQDLVQETFLQALRSKNPFRGESAVYTWLHGILRNLCLRHHRKHKRVVVLDCPLPTECTALDPAMELDQTVCGLQLKLALQKLSPEHREVIVLRYYEGLKIEEIAARTDTSPGTVKSRLHYAARMLERLLPSELNLFASDATYR
jgi:RNA polymerase sigma-70 factor (ECF subfamily)